MVENLQPADREIPEGNAAAEEEAAAVAVVEDLAADLVEDLVAASDSAAVVDRTFSFTKRNVALLRRRFSFVVMNQYYLKSGFFLVDTEPSFNETTNAQRSGSPFVALTQEISLPLIPLAPAITNSRFSGLSVRNPMISVAA